MNYWDEHGDSNMRRTREENQHYKETIYVNLWVFSKKFIETGKLRQTRNHARRVILYAEADVAMNLVYVVGDETSICIVGGVRSSSAVCMTQ